MGVNRVEFYKFEKEGGHKYKSAFKVDKEGGHFTDGAIVLQNTALICTKYSSGETVITTVDMGTGRAGGIFQAEKMTKICVWGSRFLCYAAYENKVLLGDVWNNEMLPADGKRQQLVRLDSA